MRLPQAWRWLGSLRLAIWLLALLTVASAIGGVIPQIPTTPNADLLHRAYGPFWYVVIRLFLLGDVFRAWWFIAFLVLFSANLAACTVRRLVRSFRALRSPVRSLAEPDLAGAVCVDWTGTGFVPDGVRQAAMRALKQKGIHAREEGDQVVGSRWRYGRLAPDLVHVGIVMILIGVFLGVFKFQGRFYVSESRLAEAVLPCAGEETSGCLKNVPFGIRVEAFGAELYPGGAAYSGFWTDVTVIEDGREVKTERIELNRPLTHRGISFYQSFYGYDLNAAQITVLVVDWDRRRNSGTFTVNVGESFRVPESDDLVVFAQFFTSFALDSEGRPVNANTPTPQNPAASLLVYRDLGGVIAPRYSDLVFAHYPAPHSSSDGPYRFYLEAFRVPRYVGLTYSRDHGYPVVWWGFVLVMVGLFAVVCLRPRRLWGILDPENERLFIVGDQKTRSSSKEWLEGIARAIERALEGGG